MNIRVLSEFPLEGDGIWWVPQTSLSQGLEGALAFAGQPLQPELAGGIARFEFAPKPGARVVFDLGPRRRAVVQCIGEGAPLYSLLEVARKGVAPLLAAKTRYFSVDLRGLENPIPAVDALVSAAVVARASLPRYGKTPESRDVAMNVVVGEEWKQAAAVQVRRSEILAQGTNQVRDLMTRAGNDLTPGRYLELAQSWGREAQADVRVWSLDDLEKEGAGAFCAVARAAGTGGIIRLRWAGEPGEPTVALVGKGITFDTGGTNLKTSHIFGMHGDMGGSAVALSLALAGRKLGWKWGLECYLAVTENLTGPQAYRPNDVVRSLSGKTIEVVDTDAEGRMCLADALALASREKPQWIFDFATLTGSCVRAVGTRMTGVYTNRPGLHPQMMKWGQETGERIWPFPLYPDLTNLKSEVADLKQCRPSGGVDHLDASLFLSEFVGPQIGWVHMDLSAAECEGGLGHVPSAVTGFGVRVGARAVEAVMGQS